MLVFSYLAPANIGKRHTFLCVQKVNRCFLPCDLVARSPQCYYCSHCLVYVRTLSRFCLTIAACHCCFYRTRTPFQVFGSLINIYPTLPLITIRNYVVSTFQCSPMDLSLVVFSAVTLIMLFASSCGHSDHLPNPSSCPTFRPVLCTSSALLGSLLLCPQPLDWFRPHRAG